MSLLRQHSVRKPLIWIYNSLHFREIIESFPNAFRVYHATEDYLTESLGWSIDQHKVAESVINLFPMIDLLVGVSAGVVRSYREKGKYSGSAIIVENGCDADFFIETYTQHSQNNATYGRNIAIYQGGINRRLDFELLHEVAQRLQNWNFWFCGAADNELSDWVKLESFPNVKHLGPLHPKALAELMCLATVGLIPYRQDNWINNSLPLKSFEYLACGLPVVTVPIEALMRNTDVFTVARTADEFAHAIESVACTRYDSSLLNMRKRLAEDNSYNKRFIEVCNSICREKDLLQQEHRKLNVAVLYDDRSTHISTIREHLSAFRKYSRHQIYFVPATPWPGTDLTNKRMDLQIFDVLILHYSVRLSLQDHFTEEFAHQMECFRGLKILFIQDEYDFTEIARSWMDRIQFDLVYTCISAAECEIIYPSSRFPRTDFLQTITGYVPEERFLENYAQPMKQRRIVIGYRGRKLHYVYGTLGYEKYRIGLDVRRLAEERGLQVDIEVDDNLRIYGSDWYRFVGSVRATLATESGSNVFDFDGSIRKAIDDLMAKHPDVSFEDVHRTILCKHEKLIRMNQISPKIFEAIRLRTALVLFEGNYSGVVKPDIHFIPLKKDYSNIESVFMKLQDFGYLEQITNQAYEDIIQSSLYSYKRFIAEVDSAIEARVVHGPRFDIFSSPIVARGIDGEIRVVAPEEPTGYFLSTEVLYGTLQREQLSDSISNAYSKNMNIRSEDIHPICMEEPVVPCIGYARRVWRWFPLGMRRRVYQLISRLVVDSDQNRSGYFFWSLRFIWRMLPEVIRKQVITQVNS
jgi:glycosyltransferase involved in cell wall biosynthesis